MVSGTICSHMSPQKGQAMLLSSKRVGAAVASLMLVAGLGIAAPAMADEGIAPLDYHDDSTFTFNLSVNGAGTTAGTRGEAKGETSPLMIYPTSIDFDTCWVYGEGSTSRYGAWASGSSLTIGGRGIVYSGDTYQRLILRTNIKEYGYSYARLTAYQCSGAGTMKGKWSPDSYERDTDIVINAGYR